MSRPRIHAQFNVVPYTHKYDYIYGGPEFLTLRAFMSSYFHVSYEPFPHGWRATLRTPLFGICIGKQVRFDREVYPSNFVWLGVVPLPFKSYCGHSYYWQEYTTIFRTYEDPLPTPQRAEQS